MANDGALCKSCFEAQYFKPEANGEMENILNCMDYSLKKRFRLEATAR